MYRNRKNEEATGNISNVEKPSLYEARCRGSQYRVESQPVKGHSKCDGLLKIGEKEVIDEDNVLVVSNILLVVFAPGYQSISDEYEERRYG